MINNKSIFLVLLSIILLGLSQTFATSNEQLDKNVVIDVGDKLQILLKEDSEFQFRGVVDASGNVTLKYLGEVKAANYTLNEFETKLKEVLLENFYRKVTLNVSVVKQSATDVYVYGAVQEPGAIKIPDSGRISIPQTIAAVKGLTTWADPENSYILRADKSSNQAKEFINIQSTLNSIIKENMVYLYAGDELYIPNQNQDDDSQILTTAPQEVIVVGQVGRPGIQLFDPGEEATIMRAIFKAGGLTQFAKGNEVKLIRYRGKDRIIKVVNVDRIIEKGYLAEDVTLSSGDMIIVPQKFISF
jgi:polysaccharide export outer membrane protein